MTELGTTTATVLRATGPFNFACSLRAMESFAPCSGDQLVVDGRVRRAFLHPTDPTRAVVAEVVGRDDGVAVTVFSDDVLTPAQTAAVGDRVSDWLSLRDDRDTFLGLARADPAMAPILAVAEGLHQVRFASSPRAPSSTRSCITPSTGSPQRASAGSSPTTARTASSTGSPMPRSRRCPRSSRSVSRASSRMRATC
ncbi:hypothetical protein [Dactylosporangium cerinum]